MEDKSENRSRTVLAGPVKDEAPAPRTEKQTFKVDMTKRKKRKHNPLSFGADEPEVPKWLRYTPLLALLFPIVSMLLPLGAGMALSGIGALLGLVSIIKIDRYAEKRWAAIAGLVIGLLLIPVYLLLMSRGIYSIILPSDVGV